MPVLDEAKQNILSRLAELEPNRREYDALLEAATDLKLEYEPGATNGHAAAPARATRNKRAQGKTTTGARRKIAPAGQRRQEMLDAIIAEPGITVKQVAEKLGLKDATALYRFQRALIADGLVRKDGAGMFPVTPAAA